MLLDQKVLKQKDSDQVEKSTVEWHQIFHIPVQEITVPVCLTKFKVVKLVVEGL